MRIANKNTFNTLFLVPAPIHTHNDNSCPHDITRTCEHTVKEKASHRLGWPIYSPVIDFLPACEFQLLFELLCVQAELCICLHPVFNRLVGMDHGAVISSPKV